MSDIGRALTRKFGPLPAWAWAGIFAGAMFLYRRSSMFTAAGGTTTSTGTSTSATDPNIAGTASDAGSAGGGSGPTTLDPGQSVYDPGTGQLLGTSPEQQPPNQTDPQAPITLEPGEAVYDPNTGRLTGNAAGTSATTDAPAKKAPKKKKTKHTAKKKPQHSNAHRKVKLPLKGKGKPRGSAKLHNPHTSPHKKAPARGAAGKNIVTKKTATRPVSTKPHSTIRSRGGTPRSAPAPARGARAVAARISSPALRQRPAAPTVVSHETQKLAQHPARAAAPAQRVAVVPRPAAPRPRPTPPRRTPPRRNR